MNIIKTHKNQTEKHKKQQLYSELLKIRLLCGLFDLYYNSKLYYETIRKIKAKDFYQYLEREGVKRLIEHAKHIQSKSQSTQSRGQISLIGDKTSDGPRFGKKQKRASMQYTGSYGIVKTHGWFFLIAKLGTETYSENVIIKAKLYEKGQSVCESKEIYNMLEELGETLDQEGISRDIMVFEGDNSYMNDEMKSNLDSSGWLFVGKGGGNKLVELDGKTLKEATYSRINFPKYKSLDKRFRKKAKVENYVRVLNYQSKLVYFQGRFPKKYQKSKHYKRFLVTNKRDATAQWAFGHYSYRWSIEIDQT